jgi:hypothetical protein
MLLHKDSNLSKRRLMSMMLTDGSDNTKVFHKPVTDDLVWGPESIT